MLALSEQQSAQAHHVGSLFQGYQVTVGIALDQEYLKCVNLGDQLSYKVKIVSVSPDEEKTKFGKGYRVDLLYTFTNQNGEVVSKQGYTILKSRVLDFAG